MTLEQLKYFHTAATLSHIGKAAEQEHISQPSLSIAIKKLEQELNVPLFQRNGRNVELTPEGAIFLPYASSILQQADQAKARMLQCSSQFHSQIRLAYTASVSCRYVPELLSDFLAQKHHSYLVYTDEMPSDDIARGLKEGRFDLGICSRIAEDPDLIQVPILHQPLVLIVPEQPVFAETAPGQPALAKTAPGQPALAETAPGQPALLPDDSDDFPLSTLNQMPFIAYRQDYPMYRQVSALAERLSLTPMTTSYAYSEDAIARLVEHGLGVSIVAHTDSLDLYRIRILSPAWLSESRDIYLTWHQFRHSGDAVQEMRQFILARSGSASARPSPHSKPAPAPTPADS